MDLLMEKANLLGISDAEFLTIKQLEKEVDYASLSRDARTSVPRKRRVVSGISCVTMPDPVYIPVKPGMTREQLRKGG